MEKISKSLSAGKYQLVKKNKLPTGSYKRNEALDNYNPVDTVGKKFDCDYLIEDLKDLLNLPQFHDWYCKVFYKLGKDRVLVIASEAYADGIDPRKLFNSKLKKAYYA